MNIVVTGANRGIGFELVKQLVHKGHTVWLTSRSVEKAELAASEIQKENPDGTVIPSVLDVTHEASVAEFAGELSNQADHIDVLVNNAGIIVNSTNATDLEIRDLQTTLETNLYGPLLTSRYILPLLRKAQKGKIINVSSEMGSLNDMYGGYGAYRISKTALNSLTGVLAKELTGQVDVFSVCPGWVKSDMGGAGAPRTLSQGAESIMACIRGENLISGGFYRDGKQLNF